jgi:hypothetical protein
MEDDDDDVMTKMTMSCTLSLWVDARWIESSVTTWLGYGASARH